MTNTGSSHLGAIEKFSYLQPAGVPLQLLDSHLVLQLIIISNKYK